MPSGTCKLTGDRGQFVKAHLIPRSLTKPNVPGNKFIQGGSGHRPIRRHSSWYDSKLVTNAGEKILSEYDNWAVKELRRLKLIWTSFGNNPLPPAHDWIALGSNGHGIRKLTCADPAKFRLFFLSLLWRAAESTVAEFQEIQLPPSDLTTLRTMVERGCPDPITFYPVTLLQLMPRGPTHNFAPIAQDEIFDLGGKTIKWSTFRFYFDGLIVHVHRPRHRSMKNLDSCNLFVGSDNTILVQTQSLYSSFQMENLGKSMLESFLQWPETTQRMTRTSQSWDDLSSQYSKIYGYGLPWTKRKERPKI